MSQEASPKDRTAPVRQGEEIEVAKLRPFLAEALGEAEEISVAQFPGGHSNLTYLVTVDGRELVLRRPPFGSKVKRAHDMKREHTVLSALSAHKPWAPKPVAFCDDPAVMGADFYLMERIDGIIVRRGVPKGIEITPAIARRMCERLFDVMIDLHATDYRAIGLGELGRPEGYVERQVSGWTKRYAASQTDDIAGMAEVAAWLADNKPESGPATLIHNDYKFDNVAFADASFDEIIGVLDWEMATVGDPLMDLGTTLCYWVEAGDHPGLKNLAFGPTAIEGMLTRSEIVAYYAERTGRDVSQIVFYFAFGLYKTAVVLQQIYYRYEQGLTQDPRFAALIEGVRLLAMTAARVVSERSLLSAS